MENKVDKLFKRLEALKVAHPDMIWKWHTFSGGYFGKSGVYVKCVCPEHYVYWDAWYDVPRCTLSAMHVLEDGEYTLIGAMRKVTYLERLDWERYDAIAARARAEQAEVQKRVDGHIEAATRPLSDKEYDELRRVVS